MTRSTHLDVDGRLERVWAEDSSGQLLSSTSYRFDAVGRRSLAALGDGTQWRYGYNSRGELQSAGKEFPSGEQMAGLQFSYNYDDIGNRTSARYGGDPGRRGSRQITYTPNTLNQTSALTYKIS